VRRCGVRTAGVLNVGTATLAAFIGAGGLGDPIVSGLALADTRMILSGAVPAAAVALGVDWVLGGVQRLVTRSVASSESLALPAENQASPALANAR
jgi:ABC-type proline/glycine betaine transport system permease subunit